MWRSSIITALLAAMIGLPAAAETWKDGFERGMDNYSVSRGAARVMLVCDPDRTRHPDTRESAAFVLLTLSDDPDASTAVFLADTGHQAKLRITSQAALQKNNPEAWEAMIGMIRDGGKISVVTAKTSVTFDLDPLAELSCL
jgi:threonine dehydrogenase-like Zn-dependent dehydrogenase